MQHMADLGVLEISTQNDGSPWIGMRYDAAHWYSWSAIYQLYRRILELELKAA